MKQVILSRRFIALILGIVAVVGIWIATSKTDAPADPWVLEPTYLYQFEDYATSATFVGRPSTPDFSTNPKAEKYRTVIASSSAAGPDFAGTYSVAEWECGTQCQAAAIVDARTGAIYEYGVLAAYGFAYKTDSALFIVNPPDALASSSTPVPATVTTDYYVFKDGTLTLLARQESGSPTAVSCAQVVVTAINPFTGEMKDFGSPCQVPYGWEPQAVSQPQNPPVSGGYPPESGPCYVGGCSSQLCTDQPDMVSTCEWTESYACYQGATCTRQSDGQCGWTMDARLSECLAQAY